MKIAFCSLLLPEEKKLAERAKGRLSGVSLHKVGTAVIQGLDENLSEPLTVFNIINTLNYPNFPVLVFPTEQWEHTAGSRDWHIGYINVVVLKYLTQAMGLYSKLKQWKKQYLNEKTVVCVHHIYFPSMLAALMLKKKYGDKVRTCLITGDMTGKYGLVSQYKRGLKQWLIGYVEKAIDKMAKSFDSFVFATRDMAEALGVQEKPFTVMECCYTAPPYTEETEDGGGSGEKIIFFAGATRKEYGIPHLLRAFSMIDRPDYRLWIAGGGNAEDLIKEAAANDPRIEFLGFISPQEVYARQKQSTALVNPRTSEHTFVKYSFASKTLDCLASGKPYIAHKLPCDPPEYAAHIQYAQDESDEALRDKVVEICELPEEQRREIGNRARDFIIREKNPKSMCRRIVQLWEQI